LCHAWTQANRKQAQGDIDTATVTISEVRSKAYRGPAVGLGGGGEGPAVGLGSGGGSLGVVADLRQ
jgi:hypothetical protein